MVASTYKSTWQSLTSFQSDRPYNLAGSPVIPTNTSRCLYSAIQSELLFILKQSFGNQGRIYPSWALKLKLNEVDWFPVPALTYVSYERLDANWMLDKFCPLAPEFIFEIVQKDQKLDAVVAKVSDYLEAGLLSVCLINPYSQTITIFTQNQSPKTFSGDMMIDNKFLSSLNLTANILFKRVGCL